MLRIRQCCCQGVPTPLNCRPSSRLRDKPADRSRLLRRFQLFFVMTSFLRAVLPQTLCARFESWRKNGASTPSLLVNGLLLTLLLVIFPLEREPFRTLRSRLRDYYPQINPECPRLLDSLRVIIQSFWLLFVKPGRPSGAEAVEKVLAGLRAAGRIINRVGELWGNFCLSIIRRVKPLSEASNAGDSGEVNDRTQFSFGEKTLIAIAVILGLILAAICITQPFNLQGQVVFLTFMFFSMIALARIRARISLMLLFVISIVVSGRYLWWRCTSTVNSDTALDLFFSCALLLAELYAFAVMVLGYFQVCWVLDRKPYPLPANRKVWPTVDIFIPTYNESLDVIKPTVYAALNLDWPADKLRVYLLDDGSRDAFKAFADEVGAGYIKREEHNHAKAGNINHAMTVTDGEFIVIFDCDHVPSCDFLLSTMGWLVKDPKIALVQTPHHFYSPDPFEKNMHLDRRLPIENSLFHDFIQKGNDTWNATMFCGSSAVMRRAALNEVGGIAVETVTEDAHTSLKLNRRGWSSAFIDRAVASGLSTETLSAHIGQRIRWARGMIQIFRLDNPLFGRGLTLPQRLCFFNAMLHFLHGLPRLIFLVAPLPYMFADIYIIYATAASIFAYVIPHMVHSAVTNQMLQRGYRYPFLSGVYETILSWYILIPTTVALIAPHVGKFNVTAKGGTIDKKYLDWDISKPYLVLIALNLIGLAIGFGKAFFSPNPEFLTLIINLGWIVYNLMILGASMAVAVEEVQTHAFPRVPLSVPMEVEADGVVHQAELVEYSQVEVRIKNLDEALTRLSEDQAVRLHLSDGEHRFTFTAAAGVFETKGIRDFSMRFADKTEERNFNRCTFARRGMWATTPDPTIDDRFLTGFIQLWNIAVYGYRSMIEFLPGKTLPALRDGIISFLPKTPSAYKTEA